MLKLGVWAKCEVRPPVHGGDFGGIMVADMVWWDVGELRVKGAGWVCIGTFPSTNKCSRL